MNPALALTAVTKDFGLAQIIRGVSLEVAAGERHAIIGPNGAGKSTLFHLISGRIAPTSGEIGSTAGASTASTVRDLPARPRAQLPDHQHLSQAFGLRKLPLRDAVVARLQIRLLAGDRPPARRRERTEWLMEQIGLTARCDVQAGVLSYAEQRSLEIGVTIAGGAKVVMLDEPTAGMNASERRRRSH